MSLLIRSWNVFHGRTYPPGRRAYLEKAIALATDDDPDVLVLQELPLWSLERLEAWSGMAAFGARTRRSIGPPARRLTDLHHGVVRSFVAGQANAVLVTRRHAAADHRTLVLNDRAFRTEETSRLNLGRNTFLAWGAEPRVAQALRIAPAEGSVLMLLNLHLTHLPERRCAEAELRRAVRFGEELAAGAPLVVAGDLNLTAAAPAVAELADSGFSAPGPDIDHIVARAVPSTPLVVWPPERRQVHGLTLSDHPPIELRVGN